MILLLLRCQLGLLLKKRVDEVVKLEHQKFSPFIITLNFRAFPLSAIYNQRLGSAFTRFTHSTLSTAYTNKVTYSPNYWANKRNSSKGNKFYRYIYPNIDKEEVLAHFDAEDRNSPTGYISYN